MHAYIFYIHEITTWGPSSIASNKRHIHYTGELVKLADNRDTGLFRQYVQKAHNPLPFLMSCYDQMVHALQTELLSELAGEITGSSGPVANCFHDTCMLCTQWNPFECQDNPRPSFGNIVQGGQNFKFGWAGGRARSVLGDTSPTI